MIISFHAPFSGTEPVPTQRQKINTLLLSELITHEQFRKLMLDLEIYVDGLADMHVIIKDIRNAHKGDIDSAPPKTITGHFEEILEKADMLSQSEILEPDAKKRRNGAKQKQSKD